MKRHRYPVSRIAIDAVGLLILVGLAVVTPAQEPKLETSGYVDDWSHHHLLFSNPGTFAQALKNNTVDRWYTITNDPRYQLQVAKRTHPEGALDLTLGSTNDAIVSPNTGSKVGKQPIKKDWSAPLGTGVAASASSTFSDEPGDGDTLTISGLGNSLVLTAHFGASSTSCTFGDGTATVDFTRSGDTGNDAKNLVSLITTGGCGSEVGVTASYSGSTVTITAASAGTAGNSITVTASSSGFNLFSTTATSLSGGTTATVQPNAYPAKYGASVTTASCSGDFVIYPTGQVGATTGANIIAYNNVYSGCTGTVPSVYWAYNTGTGYAVTTAPVFNGTGSEVAFIQSSGTAAQLVVLKWASSATESLTSPGTPTTSTDISTCTAPCMTVTSLANNDTYSSPFYDYAPDDALYVGDDSGYLEEFTGVFNGTASPANSTVQLNTAPYAITSPVFDFTSGCVFVGDTQGYLYKVNSTETGTVCDRGTLSRNETSAILGDGGANEGIFDAPLLDTTAQEVYVFVTDSAHVADCAAGDNCVAEFPTDFVGGARPEHEEPLGSGGEGYNLYAGTFDNLWFASTNSTGNLYVVGNTGATTGANLYRVEISDGAISEIATAVRDLTETEYPWPSPAIEFCNNGTSACEVNTEGTETTSGTDYLFFSVNFGTATGCTASAGNGCVLSYNISNPGSVSEAGSGYNITTPGTDGCWATAGLVIDNSATGTTGAQNIYFVNLDGAAAGAANGSSYASSNCTAGAGPTLQAVQTSQSNP